MSNILQIDKVAQEPRDKRILLYAQRLQKVA